MTRRTVRFSHLRFVLVILLASCVRNELNTSPPGAPDSLTPTPGDGRVTLSWRGSATEGVGYGVYQGTDPEALAKVADVPAGALTYEATGLTNGTTYHFAVDAANPAGLRSSRSATVSATPVAGEVPVPSDPYVAPGTIFGTVTAPSGGDVSGTTVTACFLSSSGGGCAEQWSESIAITQSGVSAPFRFNRLEGGSYIIVTLKDNNGNQQPDDDDFYGKSAEASVANGIAVRVDMTMVKVGDKPDHGGSPDTIKGTLTAPSGVDLMGVEVFVGPYDCSDCNSSEIQTTVSVSGSSAGYTVSSLTSGQYQVIAIKDMDGNNELSDGDYFGDYLLDGSDLETVFVMPPAEDIDITLELYTDDDGNGGEGDYASLEGTLTAPPGQSFTGTLYLNICYQNDCNDENNDGKSVFLTLEASGLSQPYSAKVQTGSCTVTVINDVNGNGDLDEGDYLGVYGGNFDMPQEVTAPATGVDVALQVVTSATGVPPLRLGGPESRFRSLFNR